MITMTPERPTILIIEDEILILDMMEREFAESGFATLSFMSAEGAIEAIDRGAKTDVIFTDVRLPGMSGWDFADRARELRPGVQILFATGYSDQPPRGIEPGQFFMKPYRIDQVVKAAKRAAGLS